MKELTIVAIAALVLAVMTIHSVAGLARHAGPGDVTTQFAGR